MAKILPSPTVAHLPVHELEYPEPVTYAVPAAYANYIMNGDATGLVPVQVKWIDRFRVANRLSFAIDCQDAGFRHSNDMHVTPCCVCNITFHTTYPVA